MAKQAYVYSGTDWVPLASEVTNLSGYYTKGEIDILDAPTGLKMVVPTSVAVGSGSGSADANGAVTFSGVSSVSLNGCFTSVYDNYRVFLEITATSASPGMNLRLRASGTDASGGNYVGGGYICRFNSATLGGQDLNASTNFELGGANSGQSSNRVAMDFQSPFLAQRTGHHSFTTGFDGTSAYGRAQHSNHNLSTSYDGFTVFPSSGTMTGTIRVYGYKD